MGPPFFQEGAMDLLRRKLKAMPVTLHLLQVGPHEPPSSQHPGFLPLPCFWLACPCP